MRTSRTTSAKGKLSVMGLKNPGKLLKIAQREPISQQTIVVTVPSLNNVRLSIHQFDNRRFPSVIAKHVQAKAFSGQIDRVSLQIDLLASELRFVVVSAQISYHCALGGAKLYLRLITPQFRLLQLATTHSPIPYRNVYCGRYEVTEVR